MPLPPISYVQRFLEGVHGGDVTELAPLGEGYWSAALSYRADGRDLVLRLGTIREGFEMDQAAKAFARPGLPVPEVLEIGDAFDRSYAISVRRFGQFLDSVSVEQADAAGPALLETLRALRSVEPAAWIGLPGFGGRRSAEDSSWRGHIRRGLIDEGTGHTAGWRALIAKDPEVDKLFRKCKEQITELVEACPERWDLIHGDLLNRNVLLSDDASHVTAIFSWKCSTAGDFLFDVAWCSFWAPWHLGVQAMDMWGRTLADPELDRLALVDAAARHHCYQLQIGATHLGWTATIGEDMTRIVDRLGALAESGF